METDPTSAAGTPESIAPPVASAPAVMSVPEPEEPAAPPPHGFERIREMVEKGVALVEQGIQPGTIPFNQGEGLDYHGFKAWRRSHSDGCDTAELDEVEAKAVVDPDVETPEAKADREVKERAGETPEAKADREAWEAETGRTTHFATPAADPAPGESVVAPATEG